jgi:hypothetical protein
MIRIEEPVNNRKDNSKVRKVMERKLGIDIPQKLKTHKVYLTATKEYQEALNDHIKKVQEELILLQSHPATISRKPPQEEDSSIRAKMLLEQSNHQIKDIQKLKVDYKKDLD